MEEKKQKKNGYGFGLRLTQAVIFTVGLIACCLAVAFTWSYEDRFTVSLCGILAIVCAVFALVGYVCAFAGKKYKWANYVSIAIGAVLSASYGFGLFSLIGGVVGLNRFKAESKEIEQDGLEEEYTQQNGEQLQIYSQQARENEQLQQEETAVNETQFEKSENVVLAETAETSTDEQTGNKKEKKKGEGLKIFLTILSLPVRAVIAFLKALLSLFGELFGDTSFGRAFKRGYNGDSYSSGRSKEFTFKDRYGNTVNLTEQPYVIDDRYQKVYKDDYGNEYVSDDGGKTIREYHRYDD